MGGLSFGWSERAMTVEWTDGRFCRVGGALIRPASHDSDQTISPSSTDEKASIYGEISVEHAREALGLPVLL